MKENIVIIVGPTGVGKTSLSLELAQKFDGEIISGDSMQVYKDLDIGTAKVTPDEAGDIPHHLIDILDIKDKYSVSDFQKQGREKIADIISRGKLPIIVGGTGLYINSLIYDMSNGGEAKPDLKLRKELENKASEIGNEGLYQQLKLVDPEAAEKIHPNNVRRVVRALEVYISTGKKFSEFQNEKKESLYNTFIIGLDTDRELLYQRINDRVDSMIQDGIMDEARMLYPYKDSDLQSTGAIGYKEFFPYFDGEDTLENSVDQLKQNSRRYAKRQLTWFRNKTDVDEWYDLVQEPKQVEEINEQVIKFLGRE